MTLTFQSLAHLDPSQSVPGWHPGSVKSLARKPSSSAQLKPLREPWTFAENPSRARQTVRGKHPKNPTAMSLPKIFIDIQHLWMILNGRYFSCRFHSKAQPWIPAALLFCSLVFPIAVQSDFCYRPCHHDDQHIDHRHVVCGEAQPSHAGHSGTGMGGTCVDSRMWLSGGREPHGTTWNHWWLLIDDIITFLMCLCDVYLMDSRKTTQNHPTSP